MSTWSEGPHWAGQGLAQAWAQSGCSRCSVPPGAAQRCRLSPQLWESAAAMQGNERTVPVAPPRIAVQIQGDPARGLSSAGREPRAVRPLPCRT